MKTILGKRIEGERTRLGLSQMELANKLNLSSSASISQYESGDRIPSDDIKLKMCELFDCSMDYLMGKSYYRNTKIRQEEITYSIAALEFIDTDLKDKINQVLQKLILMNTRDTIYIPDLDVKINSILQESSLDFPTTFLLAANRIVKTIFLDFLERPILFTSVSSFMSDYSVNSENEINKNDSEEIRAIARDVAKLKPEKKELFKNLLKQMSDEADEANKK